LTLIFGWKYEGQFDDFIHGLGKIVWQDSDYYEGSFIRGLRIGNGTLHTIDGRVIQQIWNEKKIVTVDSVPPKFPIDDN